MDSTLIFLTFSDGNHGFIAAGKRLNRQAKKLSLFRETKWLTLNDLYKEFAEFRSEHETFISSNKKGLGLWIWKPAALTYALRLAHEGEVVVMLDSGCQFNWNAESATRWEEYIAKVQETGGLFMQLQNGQFGYPDLTDNAWCKSELLELLDPKCQYRQSGQIQSGIILITNDEKGRNFAKEWWQWCVFNDYSILKGPTDFHSQHLGFYEHRWEQSILSLLVKKAGYSYIPDETYYYPNWETGHAYPIWAMRNRSGGDAKRRNLLDLLKLTIARVLSHLQRLK